MCRHVASDRIASHRIVLHRSIHPTRPVTSCGGGAWTPAVVGVIRLVTAGPFAVRVLDVVRVQNKSHFLPDAFQAFLLFRPEGLLGLGRKGQKLDRVLGEFPGSGMPKMLLVLRLVCLERWVVSRGFSIGWLLVLLLVVTLGGPGVG